MNVQKLGHIVLRVKNRERSEAFYHGALGLPIQVRYEPIPSTFFGFSSDHHCLAIMAIGEDAVTPTARTTGLRHVAFKIGDSPAQLLAAKRTIEEAGYRIVKILDHVITYSLYVEDPDGNEVELYVDISDSWKSDPSQIVATPKPLKLE